ncbi:hypothetical protein HK104_002212 [Borealophlyctis nickersoniae]|nr:hypothetical protein HK104_002212 [Borealophlyctis nickersoniae]
MLQDATEKLDDAFDEVAVKKAFVNGNKRLKRRVLTACVDEVQAKALKLGQEVIIAGAERVAKTTMKRMAGEGEVDAEGEVDEEMDDDDEIEFDDDREEVDALETETGGNGTAMDEGDSPPPIEEDGPPIEEDASIAPIEEDGSRPPRNLWPRLRLPSKRKLRDVLDEYVHSEKRADDLLVLSGILDLTEETLLQDVLTEEDLAFVRKQLTPMSLRDIVLDDKVEEYLELFKDKSDVRDWRQLVDRDYLNAGSEARVQAALNRVHIASSKKEEKRALRALATAVAANADQQQYDPRNETHQQLRDHSSVLPFSKQKRIPYWTITAEGWCINFVFGNLLLDPLLNIDGVRLVSGEVMSKSSAARRKQRGTPTKKATGLKPDMYLRVRDEFDSEIFNHEHKPGVPGDDPKGEWTDHVKLGRVLKDMHNRTVHNHGFHTVEYSEREQFNVLGSQGAAHVVTLRGLREVETGAMVYYDLGKLIHPTHWDRRNKLPQSARTAMRLRIVVENTLEQIRLLGAKVDQTLPVASQARFHSTYPTPKKK